MHLTAKIGLPLVALMGGGALAVHLIGRPMPAPPPAAAVPVVTAVVQQGDVPIILNGLGTVQALNTAWFKAGLHMELGEAGLTLPGWTMAP
jgi:multidrug efflux system membrane fusion protein